MLQGITFILVEYMHRPSTQNLLYQNFNYSIRMNSLAYSFLHFEQLNKQCCEIHGTVMTNNINNVIHAAYIKYIYLQRKKMLSANFS